MLGLAHLEEETRDERDLPARHWHVLHFLVARHLPDQSRPNHSNPDCSSQGTLGLASPRHAILVVRMAAGTENHSDVHRIPGDAIVCLGHLFLRRPYSVNLVFGGFLVSGDATNAHGTGLCLHHVCAVALLDHQSDTLDQENDSSDPCSYVVFCGIALYRHLGV